jgi:cytochrome c oxidase cbb3-type subunit 3
MGIFPGHPLFSREEAAGDRTKVHVLLAAFSMPERRCETAANPSSAGARPRASRKHARLRSTCCGETAVLICAAMNSTSPDSVRVSKPLSFVAAVFSVFILANAFIVGCGGGSSKSSSSTSGTEATPSGGETGSSESGSSMGTETASSDTSGGGVSAEIAMGKQIYMEKCTLCHGQTGHGDGPGAAALDPKPRNHTDGSYMNSRTNAQLIEVIKNGKGQMPAWGSQLTDEQVHHVLAYVRTLAVPPYTGPMP